MPPKRNTRQSSVEDNHEEAGEETGGEVITTTAGAGPNTSLVSGFSNKQVNNLMTMITATMDAKLEAYFGRFDQNRQRSDPIPAIPNQQSTPQQPTTSPPV